MAILEHFTMVFCLLKRFDKVKEPWLIVLKNKRKETIMMTLRQFSAEPSTIPRIACWYLADLSKEQGKQELYTHQSPQRLKLLCEHALIESVVSSNRIEGINIGQLRIAKGSCRQA